MKYDKENDGEVDRVTVIIFNDKGRKKTVKKDSDNDGNYEETQNAEFDENGYVDKVKIYRDNEEDYLLGYTFSNQEVTVWRGDINGENGNIVGIYKLNNEGNITQFEDNNLNRFYYYSFDYNRNEYEPVEIQVDHGKDGSTDSIKYNSFNTIGGRIVRVKQEIADGGDGSSIDRVMEYFYNEDGYRIREETDYQNDGELDEIEYDTLNDQGWEKKVEIDSEADGSIDSVRLYSYEEVSSSDNGTDSSDSEDGGGSSGGCFISTVLNE